VNLPDQSPNFQNLHTYFLANVSHEFKTPLASLLASLELLIDNEDHLSREERHVLLNSVHLSAASLQTLVNNLLESTSIEAGHFVIKRSPLQIGQVLANAIAVVQPMLDQRQQWLVLTKPFTLPVLHADPVRLTQVFINLLTNASKYSPLAQKIDLGIDVLDKNILIAVADRGAGIPEAERADVFRDFTRHAATETEQYGSGLGLSVVKAIIDGHGGTVSIEDRPGGGTIFWVTLPIGDTLL